MSYVSSPGPHSSFPYLFLLCVSLIESDHPAQPSQCSSFLFVSLLQRSFLQALPQQPLFPSSRAWFSSCTIAHVKSVSQLSCRWMWPGEKILTNGMSIMSRFHVWNEDGCVTLPFCPLMLAGRGILRWTWHIKDDGQPAGRTCGLWLLLSYPRSLSNGKNELFSYASH